VPSFQEIIQFFIVVLVCGAAWFFFKLGAEYIGLPPIAMTVITVLIVLFIIIAILNWLKTKV
jgi:hypothetical protein